MMKLYTEKVICLKLLCKLDKVLQNDILQVLWSAKPCKSGLQHCRALLIEEITANKSCAFTQKENWWKSSSCMFLSQIYPLAPTLPEACTGLSYRTFFNRGVSRSGWGPARAVWGHVHAHTEAGDAAVLPLPPSHNPPNLGTAVRTWKTPKHTEHTLSGQEFHSLAPEVSDPHPHPLKRQNRDGETVQSIFLWCMQSIPPIQLCQCWLPKALATPKCHHNSSNSLLGAAI